MRSVAIVVAFLLALAGVAGAEPQSARTDAPGLAPATPRVISEEPVSEAEVTHARREPARMGEPARPTGGVALPGHVGPPEVSFVAPPELEDVARKLTEGAEKTLARIASDLAGLRTPVRVELRVVRDASELASVAPPGRSAPAWAVGVAWPDLGIVAVALRRGAEVLDAEQTMRHELAHLALGAALGPRAPRWLHEGFAYQHSAEWTWSRTETLAGLAWFGKVVPLDQLDATFPAEEAPAHRAYAQSYDFVGYLSRRGYYEDSKDDGDRRPFRTFLAELGRGATLDAAAMKSFGRPMKLLFEEWKADLNSRYKFIPLALLGLAAWVVVSLLLVVAWLRRKRLNKKRIAQWEAEDAARAAASTPGDSPPTEPPAAPPPSPPPTTGSTQVIAPPYVPWPGEDPFDVDPDDEPKRNPRLLN